MKGILFSALIVAFCASTFSQTVQANDVKSVAYTQEQLKGKVVEYFDSLGNDPTAKYDVVIVTITHFKKTEVASVDSTSIKLSNNGISATEITKGETIKETVTLRSGIIGGRKINNLESGNRLVTPISKREPIGNVYHQTTQTSTIVKKN